MSTNNVKKNINIYLFKKKISILSRNMFRVLVHSKSTDLPSQSMDREDPGKTAPMLRLIWVFASKFVYV